MKKLLLYTRGSLTAAIVFVAALVGVLILRIRLLYARPGEDELAGIIKKFRYETNVVPTIAG